MKILYGMLRICGVLLLAGLGRGGQDRQGEGEGACGRQPAAGFGRGCDLQCQAETVIHQVEASDMGRPTGIGVVCCVVLAGLLRGMTRRLASGSPLDPIIDALRLAELVHLLHTPHVKNLSSTKHPRTHPLPGPSASFVRWDDDVVFKNQTRSEPKAQKRFINDTIRNDFHKRFLEKYIRLLSVLVGLSGHGPGFSVCTCYKT
eukprot:1155712-Pelagomonas_calceolata.AAC.6